MITRGIHHVSINVDDVPSAERFYTGVLGLERMERPELGFPGAWLRAGEQEVHLLGIQSGKPPREQHFAFLVDDLDAVIAQLRAPGASTRAAYSPPALPGWTSRLPRACGSRRTA